MTNASGRSIAMREGGVLVSMFYEGLFQWDGNRFIQWAKQPDVSPPRRAASCRTAKAICGRAWPAASCSAAPRANGGNTVASRDCPPTPSCACWKRADGTIWAAAGKRRPLLAGRWRLWPPAGRRSAVANEGVISLLEDREQNLWVGTRARGLARLKPKRVSVLPISSGETEAEPERWPKRRMACFGSEPAAAACSASRTGSLIPSCAARPSGAFPMSARCWPPKMAASGGAPDPRCSSGKTASCFPTTARNSGPGCGRIASALCAKTGRAESGSGTQNGQLRLLRAGQFLAFTNAQPAAPVTDLLQQADGTLLIGTYGQGLLRLHGRRMLGGPGPGRHRRAFSSWPCTRMPTACSGSARKAAD